MKWSKLKQTVEQKFADCLKKRVRIYATRYTTGSYFMVRGWITVDGKEIASFSTPDNYGKFGWNTPDISERIPQENRTEGAAVEKGEFSRSDLINSCRDFINMNIDDAFESDNPIIKALAVLDKRLGKRRLRNINTESLHPLVLTLLYLRMECEGISVNRISET